MVLQQRIWRVAASSVQVLTLAGAGAVASAQSTVVPAGQGTHGDQAAGVATRAQATAIKQVANAVEVVRRMASEPGMKALLAQAKGVFIVPTYGRAALALGASSGTGLLVLRRIDGKWTDPVFFSLGGLSIGAQAGAGGGAVAFVLMNDKAVNSFRQTNNFSLSADAGLTVVNYSKMAQGSAGAGDVVAWAGTTGMFGNVATLALRDIRFNARATEAYYGRPVTLQDIVEGKASNPYSEPLKQTLANPSAVAP